MDTRFGAEDSTSLFGRSYGTSENAVKTQVWVANSVYVLAAILNNKQLQVDPSMYEIPQILSVTVFEESPILLAFSHSPRTNSRTQSMHPIGSVRLIMGQHGVILLNRSGVRASSQSQEYCRTNLPRPTSLRQCWLHANGPSRVARSLRGLDHQRPCQIRRRPAAG